MAPLVRTQPLHGHQDSVTLTTMVSPRPAFIRQHSIKQAVFTIHPVHQGATGIFGCFQSIQEQVGGVFSLLLREPHTHTCPTNKINIHCHLPQLSSSPFTLPHSSAFPARASFPDSGSPETEGKPGRHSSSSGVDFRATYPHIGHYCLGSVREGLFQFEDSSLTYPLSSKENSNCDPT